MNPAKNPAIISVRNVTQKYPSGVTALQDVTFDVNANACVLITGPSGAGKSSLLKIIRGDIDPTKGEVMVHDFRLKDFNKDDKTLLRQSTGYLDQDPQFLGSLTVIENLKFFSEMGAHNKFNVHDLLEKVGLGFTEDLYPAELSRGQRQIIQILRAVIHQPFLLVADEPIAHLDESLVQVVMQLFKELQQSGTTLIIATHRIDPFMHFSNRVHIQLNKGVMM